jgi:hypothetical protein
MQDCQYTKEKCTHIKQPKTQCVTIAIHNVFKISWSSKTQLLFRLFVDYFWKKIIQTSQYCAHVLTLVDN